MLIYALITQGLRNIEQQQRTVTLHCYGEQEQINTNSGKTEFLAFRCEIENWRTLCSSITLTKLYNQVCIHGEQSFASQKDYIHAVASSSSHLQGRSYLFQMGKCILSVLCEPLAHPEDTFSYKINTKTTLVYRFRSYSTICSRIIQLIF